MKRVYPDGTPVPSWAYSYQRCGRAFVTGNNDENQIRAEGRTHAEAWYRATLQAEAVGLLAKTKESGRIRF